jgi:plastocyanin
MKSLLVLIFFVSGIQAVAADMKVFKLTAKGGTFSPAQLTVPSGEKFKIEMTNEGPGAEEFESVELNREKVVGPGKTVTIFLGPLSAGEYNFFGDFHRDTAKGKIIAKANP